MQELACFALLLDLEAPLLDQSPVGSLHVCSIATAIPHIRCLLFLQ